MKHLPIALVLTHFICLKPKVSSNSNLSKSMQRYLVLLKISCMNTPNSVA